MKNWWEILGVDVGADLRAVKRAYAAKLKAISQDTDFMELRAAYETAQKYIRHNERETNASEVFQPSDEVEKDEGQFDGLAQPELQSDKVAPLIARAENIIQNKEKRGVKDAWQELFAQLDGLDVDEYVIFEKSLQYVLGQNSHRIIHEESKRSRRGGMIRPIIMNGETGRYIFEHFGWNNPQNPELFSEDMKGLRNLLNAHSDATQEAMVRETEERQESFRKADKEKNPIAIGIMIFVAIGVIRLLIKLYNGELF